MQKIEHMKKKGLMPNKTNSRGYREKENSKINPKLNF